jgi:Flp pilus assembly protein TadG
MTFIHPTLRSLVKDQRGNVLMTFGLTSILAMAAVGGAVDFGRAYKEKSRMQNALDAAVVSGVSRLRAGADWTEAEGHAAAIFRAVFDNAVQKTAANNNPSAGLDQPIVQFQKVGNSISGSVSMTTNTPFLKFMIGHNLVVGSSSTGAPPSGKMLEVALMVDLTGSMGWNAEAGATAADCNIVASPQKKIDYLKCAGEDLLNILLPSNGSNDQSVKIGIAPFADYVNAGQYAALVVDPVLYPATGGTYSPRENLAQTRQGAFTGSYTGVDQTTGSQFGSIGTAAPSGATNTSAGATYSNSHCIPATFAPSNPVPGTLNSTIQRWSQWGTGYFGGVPVTITGNGAKPTSVLDANNTSALQGGSGRLAFGIWQLRLNNSQWTFDVSGTLNSAGQYYVPIVTNRNSATAMTHNGHPVGIAIDSNNPARSASSRPAGISRNSSGYFRANSFNSDTQTWNLTWVSGNNQLYVPLFNNVETGYVPGSAGGTFAGCETGSTTSQTATSQLITCVTERRNGSDLDYTAAAIGTGRFVGPYNHGSSSKSNYSSDGRCWSAGREMPAVIPLTNQRSTLNTFFQTATVGGATAGHLGTAWASYILSPNFASVWPDRAATPYTTSNVQKAAILMTDGEYNIRFSNGGSSSNTSAKQALEICKEMRDQGIKVFTVGFGFGANVTAPNVETMTASQRTTPLSSGTAQQRAIDTLAKCASDNSTYFFPYDGQALRTVFQNIAATLSSDLTGGKARLTN